MTLSPPYSRRAQPPSSSTRSACQPLSDSPSNSACPSFVAPPPPSAFTLTGAGLSRHAPVDAVTSKSAARSPPSAVPLASSFRQAPVNSVSSSSSSVRFASSPCRASVFCWSTAPQKTALVGWTEQRKREIGEALDQALLALREAVLDGIDVSVHLTNRQAVQLRSLRRALLSTDADEDDDAVSIVSASPPGTQLTPGMSTQRSTEKTELANWPLIDFERLLNLLILWIFWFF
ncbi:hypothetical protein niasHT_031539 [Heterodera trifolii]|uniref:Uncharacterized protein n=1 Tax=Heterodera trifolii TaxID=157864 RepID=A0ABD2HS87_9BILA